MQQCIVLADDLICVNAIGRKLKENEFQTILLLNTEDIEEELFEYDCVVIHTNSRKSAPIVAYDRVYQAMNCINSENVIIYSKCVNEQYEGNIGSELDAMLDCSDPNTIVAIVPSLLQINRRVDQIYERIGRQTRYNMVVISLEVCKNSKDKIVQTMRRETLKGNRIFLFDCTTKEEWSVIADALIISGFSLICMDQGEFTALITNKMIKPQKKHRRKKVLALIEETKPMDPIQIDSLRRNEEILEVSVCKEKLMGEDWKRVLEAKRVVYEMSENSSDKSVVYITMDIGEFLKNKGKGQLHYEKGIHLFNDGISYIAYKAIKKNKEIDVLVMKGHNLLQAVCKRFQAIGIQQEKLENYLVPRNFTQAFIQNVMYGTIVGGEFAGMKVVYFDESVSQEDVYKCITNRLGII